MSKMIDPMLDDWARDEAFRMHQDFASAQAEKYVAHIRNEIKRSYAANVLIAIKRHMPLPDHPAGLSYMACQAVRLNLEELLRA